MPLPIVIVFYGFAIIIGIILVTYGVSRPPREKESSSGSNGPEIASGFSDPTDEVLTLRFRDDSLVHEGPMCDASRLDPPDPIPSGRADTRILSRILASAAGILKAPSCIFSRKRCSKDEGWLDKPLASGVVLGPEEPGATREPTDPKG